MKKVRFFIGTLANGGAERVVSNLSLQVNERINKEILIYDSNSKISYPYNGNLVYMDKERKKNILDKIKRLIVISKKIKKIKGEDENGDKL